MDEIIRLSGYMWDGEQDREAVVEKLCKILVLIIFGVCLWTAAESLSSSGADERGYSAESSFVRNQAVEDEKQGMIPLAFSVSDSLDFSVPAPIPAPAVDQKVQENMENLGTQAVPSDVPAGSGSAVSAIPVESDQAEGSLAEEPEEVLPAMLTIRQSWNCTRAGVSWKALCLMMRAIYFPVLQGVSLWMDFWRCRAFPRVPVLRRELLRVWPARSWKSIFPPISCTLPREHLTACRT